MRLSLPFSQRGDAPAVKTARAVDPGAPLFDEATIAGFRKLVLLSSQTIAEGLAGEHRSRRRGSSPEFADFKIYSQGDDFRRIDWNLYARLDEVFVRLSEVTTELSVHVLLDCSNSMDWRGIETTPSKFRYARQLAGALCYVSLWHFDRVSIVPFGHQLGHPFGPSQGRSYTIPMLQFLSALPTMGETDLPSVVEQYVHARRRPGMMLLVSDLLSGEPEQLRQRLRDLRARGWQTIVAHIVDPAELTPETSLNGGGTGQPAEFIDLETAEKLRITPTIDVVDRYRTAVQSWLEEIEAACKAEQADYIRLQTDWPFQSVVLNMLHRRGIVA